MSRAVIRSGRGSSGRSKNFLCSLIAVGMAGSDPSPRSEDRAVDRVYAFFGARFFLVR